MDISIREGTEDDIDAMQRLCKEVDALHCQALPHVFRQPDGPPRTEEFFHEILSGEDAVLLIAEREGRVVGFAHVAIREASDFPVLVPRRYAALRDIVVTADCRRAGIGAALVDEAQMELNVWEFNENAIAFYKDLGYETAGRKMWKELAE